MSIFSSLNFIFCQDLKLSLFIQNLFPKAIFTDKRVLHTYYICKGIYYHEVCFQMKSYIIFFIAGIMNSLKEFKCY